MIKDEWHMLTDWQMLAEIDEEEETRVEILEGLIKYLKKGEVNHG